MNYAVARWRDARIGDTVMGSVADKTITAIEPSTIGMRVVFSDGISIAVHAHDHVFIMVAHRRNYERSDSYQPIQTRARIS